VVGTDDFASSVCLTTGCDVDFNIFVFASEQIEMLGSPSNNYHSSAIIPSSINQFGYMQVTVLGTGFRKTVTTSGAGLNFPVFYFCYYFDAVGDGIGSDIGYQATYINNSTIVCATPQEEVSSGGRFAGSVQVTLERHDDCEIGLCSDYVIAEMNITWVNTYIDSVTPLNSDGTVVAGDNTLITFVGTFVAAVAHWCVFSDSDGFSDSTYAVNVSATATSSSASCTVPNLASHKVKIGDDVYITLYEGAGQIHPVAQYATYAAGASELRPSLFVLFAIVSGLLYIN